MLVCGAVGHMMIRQNMIYLCCWFSCVLALNGNLPICDLCFLFALLMAPVLLNLRRPKFKNNSNVKIILCRDTFCFIGFLHCKILLDLYVSRNMHIIYNLFICLVYNWLSTNTLDD